LEPLRSRCFSLTHTLLYLLGAAVCTKKKGKIEIFNTVNPQQSIILHTTVGSPPYEQREKSLKTRYPRMRIKNAHQKLIGTKFRNGLCESSSLFPRLTANSTFNHLHVVTEQIRADLMLNITSAIQISYSEPPTACFPTILIISFNNIVLPGYNISALRCAAVKYIPPKNRSQSQTKAERSFYFPLHTSSKLLCSLF